MNTGLVISCEHASAAIPAPLRGDFLDAGDALRSHRGSDIGALALARRTAASLGASLHATRVSRLVVDTNRSLSSRSLFSPWTRNLPREDRERLLARYWHPYRDTVCETLEQALKEHDRVLHWSVHSFTPVFDGVVRDVDVGLLYDPARHDEKAFAARYRQALTALDASLRIAMNRPYRGSADGFTRFLRTRFHAARYAGIELEVSQRFPLEGGPRWRRLQAHLIEALRTCIAPVSSRRRSMS